MNDGKPAPKITTFRIRLSTLEKQIKQLAADSQNIAWSKHAHERMDERGIDDIDVLRVLRGGTLMGSPEMTGDPG
jgi:hypothetical protein